MNSFEDQIQHLLETDASARQAVDPVSGKTVDKASAIIGADSADKVIYFDAADDAPYAVTVEAMDLARQGGAKTIAILTSKIVR